MLFHKFLREPHTDKQSNKVCPTNKQRVNLSSNGEEKGLYKFKM